VAYPAARRCIGSWKGVSIGTARDISRQAARSAGNCLHRRLQAACDEAAEAGRRCGRGAWRTSSTGDVAHRAFSVDGGAGRLDDSGDRLTGAVLDTTRQMEKWCHFLGVS
jgi:hypothetical protein